MKGYDGYFLLNWCVNNGIKPETIYNGSKIMVMEVKKLGIRIIDSINFIPQPLKHFPKTFGLAELKKDYFPHYFNKPCNQNCIGPLPSKIQHGYRQMSRKDKKEFEAWYEQKVSENYVFDMQKELLECCRSDVDILRRSCLQFRENFIEIANIDPFQYITIASVCMAIFRALDLKDETIAVVNNVDSKKKYSNISIAWLDYVTKTKGINIKHALNGVEETILLHGKKRRVDGFSEANNTVYEFQGCFWHGCPKSHSGDIIVNTSNQLEMKELYNRTLIKNQAIRDAGFNLVEV